MEDEEPSSWPAAAFISAIHEEEQQEEEQNGGHKCHKMAPAVSLPSVFTRGSYRRYMNYLIKSNSSEKPLSDSPIKTTDVPLRDCRLQKIGDNVRSTHSRKQDGVLTDKTSSYSNTDCSSNLRNSYFPVEERLVTPVPGGDNTNYVVWNRNLNSRVSRPVSLVSLSRVSSDMKGPVVPANSVETDGGVHVDNEGNAPFRSFKHPSSPGRTIASQFDAEVDETLSAREKCNTEESRQGRQRKTGAVAEGRSHSAGAEQEANDRGAETSTALRFPCVEKLIHRYSAMITEQKERVMAEKQGENQSREKHNQGNIENKFSNQCQEFCEDSSKRKTVPLQQNREPDHSKQPAIPVQGREKVRIKNSDHSQYAGLSEHVQHCEFVIGCDDASLKQVDDLHGRTEHPAKRLSPYRNETAGLLQGTDCKNSSKLHREENFRGHTVQRDCDSDSVERTSSHSEHRDGRDYVTACRGKREKEYHSLDLEHLGQWDVLSGSTDYNMKMQHQPEIKTCRVQISESVHCSNCVNEQGQVCEGNTKEETGGALQQTSESVTSVFIKSSTHVTQNISHVGGTTASAIEDEGRHKLMLPRAAQRSVSPASDEGCSVVPPPECGLTPCSSEGDIVTRLVAKPTARWTWPPESDDQDFELQGRIHRHEYGRCGSSDSAVCLLPSDDERKLQMKDARLSLRKVSVDSDILDIITSRDPSCDKAMVFDRYMNKTSDLSFDLDNCQHIWRHGSFPSGCRRDSDVFPDSVSRQNIGDRGDTWIEEIRNNSLEAECENVCDSGIDRGTFLGRTGDSCWDVSSVEEKSGDYSLDDDRYRATAPNVYGYPWKYRQRQFSKLRSMISCESGVVEDEDRSRKSSTAEPTDDDGYNVELRRQSAQSFQTDDEESSANSQYRYWRTPSVVVSDYSDDGPYFTSVTLEELEQMQDVSSSDCASGGSSVSGSLGVSAGDTECGLRTPERKASDCSTCSTLSGDESSCDALLQPLRTRQKVGQ